MKGLDVKLAIAGVTLFWCLVVLGTISNSHDEPHTHTDTSEPTPAEVAEVEDKPETPAETQSIGREPPLASQPEPGIPLARHGTGVPLAYQTQCLTLYSAFKGVLINDMASHGLSLEFDNQIRVDDGVNFAISDEMFVRNRYMGQIFASVEGDDCLLAADLINGESFSESVKLN